MTKYRNIIFATFFVAVSLFVVFEFTKNNQDFFGELLKNYRDSEIVQTINREVNNPGALIAEIESSRAHLTKDGVFSFTNKERQDMNMVLFNSDPALDKIAKMRMDDMFAKGYFEHVSPAGESASSVADDIGYEYISIGENIALGNFETDQILVQAWMDSPGHRANILNSKFTNLGVAVGKGVYKGRETWIGVQIFSRPLSMCPDVDENLKIQIDNEISQIENMKIELEKIEKELEEMHSTRRQNRDEYNAKVEEYNNLARAINQKNLDLTNMIEIYNQGVKSFNSCLEQ